MTINRCVRILFLLVIGLPSMTAHSHGNHSHSNIEEKASDKVSLLLKSSETAGHSHEMYEQATLLLRKALKAHPRDNMLWYQWARVLQHDHQFEQALKATDRALTLKPSFPAALLLKSSLHLTLAQYSQAQQSCNRLVGKASAIIVVACSSEILGYVDDPKVAYEKLQGAIEQFGISDDITGQWVVQIAAEMAYRMGHYPESAQWLSNFDLDNVPVSYLVLWSDTHLALNKHQMVLTRLSTVLQKHEHIADALLLRMALAEEGQITKIWTPKLDAVMQQRLAEHDTHHAGEVARYLLMFKEQPEKALYWANINWEQSKLAQDKDLLELIEEYKL